MKIGFFGGSFNPPTYAHINLAKKALIECGLDKVVFVPIGDFYEKKELAPAKHRYNMLKIACKNLDNIEVSDIELDVKEKIYAIDAFRMIENKFKNTEIYYIMGADNFISMMKWKCYEELLEKYRYIVLERDDINIKKYIEEKKLDKSKVIIIKNDEYRCTSSSNFRLKTKEERQYNDNIIPDKIKEYITNNNLY